MKKVLISGMTASQSSSAYSERSATFIGSVAEALRKKKIQVDWHVPGMDSSTIDAYDSVIVGVAPILSLAANRSFNALSLIESLWETDRLTLFIDAPEPAKIHASLRSASKTPESLMKPLYSRRPGYSALATDKRHAGKIFSVVEKLTHDTWKKTLFPALPWSSIDSALVGLPENITKSCVGINVDSYILDQKIEDQEDAHRYNQWVVEAQSTKWVRNVSNSLMYPAISAKTKRTDSDMTVLETMRSSIGVLIGPHDDKVLWWSSRFAQAMNTRTPVATEWRESSSIGSSWSHLASGVEEMDHSDRYELSTAQKYEYSSAIPNKEQVTETLIKELSI